MAGAATGEAAAVGAAEDEGELLVAGDDGDAAGLDEQIVRDAAVGGVHDLFEDLGGLVRAGDVVLMVGGERHLGAEERDRGENQNSFQQVVSSFKVMPELSEGVRLAMPYELAWCWSDVPTMSMRQQRCSRMLSASPIQLSISNRAGGNICSILNSR